MLDDSEVGTPYRSVGLAIQAHLHYRKGHLPAWGGTGNQPWLLMKAIEVVEREVSHFEVAKMEETREKAKGEPDDRVIFRGRGGR
jgi:hypothetical protein